MQTNMNVEHIYILYQSFLRLSLRFASFSSIFLLSFIYCSNEVCSICLKVLSSKAKQLIRHAPSIFMLSFGKSIVSRDEQSEKHSQSSLMDGLFMVILFNDEQPLKASVSILRTLAGNSISFKFSHHSNASFPISFTDEGIVMFVRFEHELKAEAGIVSIF